MTPMKSLADLKKHQEVLLNKKKSAATIEIKVALATCGIASGGKEIFNFLKQETQKRGIEANIASVGCMGFCYAEPTIEVTLPNKAPVIFGFVDIAKADEIIEKYIKKGELTDGVIPINYVTI